MDSGAVIQDSQIPTFIEELQNGTDWESSPGFMELMNLVDQRIEQDYWLIFGNFLENYEWYQLVDCYLASTLLSLDERINVMPLAA